MTETKSASFQLVELEFFRRGHWYKTDVSVDEYSQIMNSGLVHGDPVHMIKLWSATESDLGVASLIYDFEKAKSGLKPFGVITS